jgi:hypothetical protein
MEITEMIVQEVSIKVITIKIMEEQKITMFITIIVSDIMEIIIMKNPPWINIKILVLNRIQQIT